MYVAPWRRKCANGRTLKRVSQRGSRLVQNLQRFGDDIWIAEGPRVSAFGPVTLPTRMILVKLRDESVWINSPVETSLEVLDEIKAIGPVRYLVAPTSLHVWRLQSWRALFPDAELWGPPASRRATPRLAFAGRLGEDATAPWTGDIEQVVFRGNAFLDEVEFFHKPSRTLIVTDFIQNYPAVRGDILGNLAKAIGGVLNGGVPRDIRWSTVNKTKARESLSTILSWDFDKAILAHGACIRHHAKPFVETAFRWLSD